MKIVFIDLEFGQIYGSWRRDFLVTQAGVLSYDTENDEIELGELHFKHNSNLVMRRKEFKKRIETVVNFATKKTIVYDENHKIPKSEQTLIRKKWNKLYSQKFRVFIKQAIKQADIICFYGASEDLKILNRYNIKIENYIDIYTVVRKDYNKSYSLDHIVKILNLESFLDDDYAEKLISLTCAYQLPYGYSKPFLYEIEHLKPHYAIGDCARMFLVLKELYLTNIDISVKPMNYKCCNGSGYIEIGVPCGPEEVQWMSDGEFMCLGTDICGCCDGEGTISKIAQNNFDFLSTFLSKRNNRH